MQTTHKCANLVKNNLNTDYSVSSFIKPSTQMSEIITTTREEIQSLTKNDVIIIWGGARDIGKNNTLEAIECVNKFMNDNKGKNIVMINSPHRHDLIPSSCVNKEVINYNSHLKEATGPHPNVKLLEIILIRNHFTRHGLHLNLTGKKLVSQEIAMILKEIFNQEKLTTYSEKAILPDENNLTTKKLITGDKANCNLFAIHTSKMGYNHVDIDIVIYILSNIIYIVLE